MASSNSSSIPSLNSAVVICAIVLSAIELVVQFSAFLISALNFSILCTSSLLHPNLKCILLVQSVVIGLNEFVRGIFVVLKFVYADMFYHGAIPVQIVSMAAISFRNLMGHVLMTERIFATIYFRSYAEKRSKRFTFCWIGILSAISIWNTWVQQGVFFNVNLATFVTTCILFSMGFAEILSLFVIYLYNLRKYKMEIYLTLSERFQLSENIRTAKQLAPTIFLHFINANVLNFVTFLIYFGVLTENYQKSFGFWFISVQNTIGCSFIEITVITHHPMIKRKAVDCVKMLLKFWVKDSQHRRVGDSSMATTTTTQKGRTLVDIHGQNLITHQSAETETYFQMLKEEWN
ncbi:hypothetical protein niasHT_020720 [Heterodera trifolii]|uniref:Gustatory receptor n=1 Tax=Heterodera trifolii TaxID=157864 RepID=A0ABD2KM49_9BILA